MFRNQYRASVPEIRDIRIQGNSMDLAGLHDGMVVQVRITDLADHRDIVVVRQADDSLTVKRYIRTRRGGNVAGAWLVPESTDDRWKARPMLDGDQIVGVLV